MHFFCILRSQTMLIKWTAKGKEKKTGVERTNLNKRKLNSFAFDL